MSETTWFRRGDGAEFEVPIGSEAFDGLVRQGAIRIEGPEGARVASEQAPAEPTRAELLERADELDIDLPKRATKAEIAAAIAEAEAGAAGGAGGGT